MCINVTRAPSGETRRGNSWQEPPNTPVHLTAWVGCSEPACGGVEAVGKK